MPAEGLLLRGGRVLLEDGVLHDLDVEVRGATIARVARGIEPTEATRVVDLGDRALVPGLIDAHTHLTHGYESVVGDREAAQGVRASFQALRALRTGLTTVRELGSYRNVDVALRDAIQAGRALGPRMLCAGAYLAITGGHGHPKGRETNGVDECRRAVREQALAGVDLIKVMCSGGAARADESADASQFTAGEIEAIVDEAALGGRKVAAHAHPTRSIKWALQAGAYSIEHGTFLDDECCELMVASGAFLVPTLNVYRTIAESERWPHLQERTAWLYAEKVRTFRRSVELGVKWAVGTDASMFLPVEEYYRELVAISEVLQLDPARVLIAASKGNAELLGIEGVGAIAEGQHADLVVLENGDPTRDLSALRDVKYTVVGGRLIDWRSLDEAFGDSWFTRHGGE